ncbi:MAG: prepilin-type N-terminal cleavage/methylation domain-containing protein [Halofilum sp. (in: g-proteobacteria)]
MRNDRPRGFTLIEMAIAMVVIGAILVAVLQGRALIDNAEYSSFKRSLNEYAEAFYSFRERFNALPGDFDEANARLDGSLSGGNGDGAIDDGPTCDSDDDESCRAWQHLRYADLLQGDPRLSGGEAPPSHPYNGVVSAYFTGDEGDDLFRHKMLVTGVPSEVARRIDRELDDGICNKGRISLDPRNECIGTEDGDWPDAEAVDLVYVM